MDMMTIACSLYRKPKQRVISNNFIKFERFQVLVKPIGEIEEKLADKAEPILGFRPSSKIKRGPIGILISIICIAIVFRELSRAGVI